MFVHVSALALRGMGMHNCMNSLHVKVPVRGWKGGVFSSDFFAFGGADGKKN